MAETEHKKDKTGLYTAIIAGVVALSTGVMTNFDKITGKTSSAETIKTEIKIDTTAFSYKLDKIIKDCPNDFSNIIDNVQDESETSKDYYSKINFQEGTSTITISKDELPSFNIIIYTGGDGEVALQKRIDILKKVSEHLKTKPSILNTTEDGFVQMINTFDKGNIEISVIDGVPENEPDGTEIVMLTVNKKS